MADEKKDLVITIARSYGSGGRTLGIRLAEKMQIPLYDREILRMASDESGINEALFGAQDEHLRLSPVEAVFRRNPSPYRGQLIPPEDSAFTSDQNLFNYQARIIRELSDEGSCIIIGRCGDYVLKGRPNVLRLFFYAPEEDCVKRLIYQTKEKEEVCRRKIRKIDKYRADYYHHYTGKDWADTRNYDLCLNTTTMSYDALIRAVEAYVGVWSER